MKHLEKLFIINCALLLFVVLLYATLNVFDSHTTPLQTAKTLSNQDFVAKSLLILPSVPKSNLEREENDKIIDAKQEKTQEYTIEKKERRKRSRRSNSRTSPVIAEISPTITSAVPLTSLIGSALVVENSGQIEKNNGANKKTQETVETISNSLQDPSNNVQDPPKPASQSQQSSQPTNIAASMGLQGVESDITYADFKSIENRDDPIISIGIEKEMYFPSQLRYVKTRYGVMAGAQKGKVYRFGSGIWNEYLRMAYNDREGKPEQWSNYVPSSNEIDHGGKFTYVDFRNILTGSNGRIFHFKNGEAPIAMAGTIFELHKSLHGELGEPERISGNKRAGEGTINSKYDTIDFYGEDAPDPSEFLFESTAIMNVATIEEQRLILKEINQLQGKAEFDLGQINLKRNKYYNGMLDDIKKVEDYIVNPSKYDSGIKVTSIDEFLEEIKENMNAFNKNKARMFELYPKLDGPRREEARLVINSLKKPRILNLLPSMTSDALAHLFIQKRTGSSLLSYEISPKLRSRIIKNQADKVEFLKMKMNYNSYADFLARESRLANKGTRVFSFVRKGTKLIGPIGGALIDLLWPTPAGETTYPVISEGLDQTDFDSFILNYSENTSLLHTFLIFDLNTDETSLSKTIFANSSVKKKLSEEISNFRIASVDGRSFLDSELIIVDTQTLNPIPPGRFITWENPPINGIAPRRYIMKVPEEGEVFLLGPSNAPDWQKSIGIMRGWNISIIDPNDYYQKRSSQDINQRLGEQLVNAPMQRNENPLFLYQTVNIEGRKFYVTWDSQSTLYAQNWTTLRSGFNRFDVLAVGGVIAEYLGFAPPLRVAGDTWLWAWRDIANKTGFSELDFGKNQKANTLLHTYLNEFAARGIPTNNNLDTNMLRQAYSTFTRPQNPQFFMAEEEIIGPGMKATDCNPLSVFSNNIMCDAVSCGDGKCSGSENSYTCSSDCQTQRLSIRCITNSDCGNDGETTSPYCSNGDVHIDTRVHTCSNPDTIYASCQSSIQPRLKETCGSGSRCENGVCKTVMCSTDAQCGQDGWASNPSCALNNVYREWKSYTCQNAASPSAICTTALRNITIQSCNAACLQGSCCTPNWQCTQWSSCQNNKKSRQCTDTNACHTDVSKPPLTTECENPFEPIQRTEGEVVTIFTNQTGVVLQTFIEDNFEEAQLNAEIWTLEGESVEQKQGTITVTEKKYGLLKSKLIPLPSTGELIISRKAYLAPVDNKAAASFAMYVTGGKDTLFGIRYTNYSVSACPRHGFWLYRNYANLDCHNDGSPLLPPLWNTWLEENLTVDLGQGIAQYYINGEYKTSLSLGVLPKNEYLQLQVSAWGWTPGSIHAMDDLKVQWMYPQAIYRVLDSRFTRKSDGSYEWKTKRGDAGLHQIPLEINNEKTIFVPVTLLRQQNNIPVFGKKPRTRATQNMEYEYMPTVTDADDDSLIFRIEKAPNGMKINATTGHVTWLPTVLQQGEHQVSMKVTDTKEESSTQNFTIKVYPKPRIHPDLLKQMQSKTDEFVEILIKTSDKEEIVLRNISASKEIAKDVLLVKIPLGKINDLIIGTNTSYVEPNSQMGFS